ncbi:hypothetical protein ABT275_33435 [Streptomyces sp. NPDC001185]|uniref:tetratricopeptide repeat protein n=1 Tax=Streptomyces sp. NPDC001185 TaxID=3154380 RepID=UPI00332510D6
MTQNVPDRLSLLVSKLRELHLHSGEPSMREIASRTSGVVSHSTIHQTLSGKRIPRWGALELIVEALGGSPSDFHSLWKDLRIQVRQVPGVDSSEAVKVSGNYRFRLETARDIPSAEDFLTLERASQIREANGPDAAAQYLGEEIGQRWHSSLMAVYLPLLYEIDDRRKLDEVVPKLRGIEMHSGLASHVVANVFDEMEEFSEALHHQEAALRQDPNNAKYASLAYSYSMTLDLLDKAHSYAELAHRLDPTDTHFAGDYISSLVSRSEFSRAEDVARNCWDNEAIRPFVGLALALRGEFSEAEKIYRSLPRLDSDDIRALSQVLLALGKNNEAATLLADRLEKNPDDLKSGVMYVEMLRNAGKEDAFRDAMRRLEAAVARDAKRIAEMLSRLQAKRNQ